MQILQNLNQISWTYHRRRQNDNGPWQTKRNQRLANSENCQTSQILAWIWKLLSMIHQRMAQPLNQLLKKDQPFIWDDDAQTSFDEMKK